MKKIFKSKSAMNMLGLSLIFMAGFISSIYCLFLIGEPELPKSLLK